MRTCGSEADSNGVRLGRRLSADHGRLGRALGAVVERLAADDGPGVLRDRDDDRDRARVRHRAPGLRSVSRVAAPSRSDDRVGPRRAQDGADREAAVRPDGRPEVGDLDGRVRVVRRRVRQLRDRARRRHDHPRRRVRPGCPPTPDGLLYAVNLIQQQIKQGGRGGSWPAPDSACRLHKRRRPGRPPSTPPRYVPTSPTRASCA